MKIFDKMLLEYTDEALASLASKRFSQLEQSVSSDLMASCSFAIWGDNTRDAEAVFDNMDLMRYDVMVVGMNQSTKVSDFGIFHQETCSSKLRNAFDGPLNRYYGAFVTDLLNIMDDDNNIVAEPDSEELKKYLKTRKGISNRLASKNRFQSIYNTITTINGKKPMVIALGDIVTDSLSKFNIQADITIAHPASRRYSKMDVYIADTDQKVKIFNKEWDFTENPILTDNKFRGRIGYIKEKNIKDILDNITIYIKHCEVKERYDELKKAYEDKSYFIAFNIKTKKELGVEDLAHFFNTYDFYKNLNIKNGYITEKKIEDLESLLNKLL